MYKKINPNMNFVEREEKVLKFWKENRIFEKTLERPRTAKSFRSTTDRPPQTASRISAIFSRAS